MSGRKCLHIFIFLSTAFSASGQIYHPDKSFQALRVRKYLDGLNTPPHSKYFYGLYHHHNLETLTEKDSVLIHRYLSHVNAFADQYTHFYTGYGYENLEKLNRREDSLMVYGYVVSPSAISAVRDWKREQCSIMLSSRNSIGNRRISSRDPGLISNGIISSVMLLLPLAYSGHGTSLFYYRQNNYPKNFSYMYSQTSRRYDYLSRVIQNERSQR